MKFKITNKAVEWLKVEYEDGSWAQIPSVAGLSKNDWHQLIKDYAPKTRVEKLEDIPWNIGDEEDTDTDITEYPSYSYEAARWALYPTSEELTTALYESRKGNNTPLTNYDTKMTEVNTLVPVDDNKIYTHEEVLGIKSKLTEEEI
tara:strand:+ start:1194 stop:1631 length:438 start_codon:yes stop_codon:yes gene_type:complete